MGRLGDGVRRLRPPHQEVESDHRRILVLRLERLRSIDQRLLLSPPNSSPICRRETLHTPLALSTPTRLCRLVAMVALPLLSCDSHSISCLRGPIFGPVEEFYWPSVKGARFVYLPQPDLLEERVNEEIVDTHEGRRIVQSVTYKIKGETGWNVQPGSHPRREAFLVRSGGDAVFTVRSDVTDHVPILLAPLAQGNSWSVLQRIWRNCRAEPDREELGDNASNPLTSEYDRGRCEVAGPDHLVDWEGRSCVLITCRFQHPIDACSSASPTNVQHFTFCRGVGLLAIRQDTESDGHLYWHTRLLRFSVDGNSWQDVPESMFSKHVGHRGP